MKTKIFCDSADIKVIKKFYKNSLVKGFTTNPSLMRLSGAKNYRKYSMKILNLCKNNLSKLILAKYKASAIWFWFKKKTKNAR